MIRVILVDDEPFLLQMLESSIAWEQYGMSVIGTFYNGKQALEYIRENEVDAVICDIMMPVMDGLAATRAIRALKRPDAAVIPIVAMTANAFAEDERQALACGMNAHVAKPIDVHALERVVAKLSQ